MQFPVYRYGLKFRLVEESDAGFILKLRTNDKLAMHLSATKNDLQSQVSWITAYKERERQGKEYYILYESEDGTPCGVFRLYHIKGNTVTAGSWLSQPGQDAFIAVKADLFLLAAIFEEFKFEQCLIDVRKKNKKVLNYHKLFFTQIGEDEENIYFSMSYPEYERKFNYLSSIIEPK